MSKLWTIETLKEMWEDRGYSKKQSMLLAERDFKEMNRKKSDIENHQVMQEMLYN